MSEKNSGIKFQSKRNEWAKYLKAMNAWIEPAEDYSRELLDIINNATIDDAIQLEKILLSEPLGRQSYEDFNMHDLKRGILDFNEDYTSSQINEIVCFMADIQHEYQSGSKNELNRLLKKNSLSTAQSFRKAQILFLKIRLRLLERYYDRVFKNHDTHKDLDPYKDSDWNGFEHSLEAQSEMLLSRNDVDRDSSF